MGDSGVYLWRNRLEAGTISRIRVENFMCHSNLEIELGDSVNFITGQNGSGKSAILTALTIAFGARAKGTQRANTIKEFIKTGCSYALIHVEIKNQGEDAFKPETYGDVIILERRITETSTTTTLKNHLGKKVASKKEDLHELVEHFNIDVENPCVVMSQDKSREFLHSGNDKDRFKFFFKATLLHRLEGLLKGNQAHLNTATELVDEMEKSLSPILKEIDELQLKIKNMEHVEEISHQVAQLRKKLAWSLVYEIDEKLEGQRKLIVELEGRKPKCQGKIDLFLRKAEELKDRLSKKKAQITQMIDRTSEVRRNKEDLEHNLSLATREVFLLKQECERKTSHVQKLKKRLQMLEQQIHEIHEQHLRSTQVEMQEMEEKLKEHQDEYDEAHSVYTRFKKDEDVLLEKLSAKDDEISRITTEIEERDKSIREIRNRILEFRRNQSNKATAFGGGRVTSLLQSIERRHYKFNNPPIGPVGVHLSLLDGDMWATTVEKALGNLLNAFIVTDHKDFLTLRECAKEASYTNLRIIIYDFSIPRLNIPSKMLPQTRHPTVISVLHSDNPTVLNVLVDQGGAERQVLVESYDVGTTVAFDPRISNVKEVYTKDGYRMFSRGSVQTVLPQGRYTTGRLCSSYDNLIRTLERDASQAEEQAERGRGMKREADALRSSIWNDLQNAKRRRQSAEKDLRSKEIKLQYMKKSYDAEQSSISTSSVDELHQERSKVEMEIQDKEAVLGEGRERLREVEKKANELKVSSENLCESAKAELDALEKAENELRTIENDIDDANAKKIHYEDLMATKVLPELQGAEAKHKELENNRKENYRKASIFCPESEIHALGCCKESTPDQLRAQLTRLNHRLQQESQRYSEESIDDLRMMHEKKQRMISKKQRTCKGFREKLSTLQEALNSRFKKFHSSASHAKRQLTWKFNGHLKKKGISGHIKVNYEELTLSIEVKMPQDASTSNVRDTRGLSGGERSFSTLCFALALHEMTEAPFRAMDEFDVFMDAVSRKISLDALVDFALAQGSQWIFITPHDISMVKHDERIKKQQMAAPRA